MPIRFTVQFYIGVLHTYSYINGTINNDKPYTADALHAALQRSTHGGITANENGWSYSGSTLHVQPHMHTWDPLRSVCIEDIGSSIINSHTDPRMSEFKHFHEMHSSEYNEQCICIIYRQHDGTNLSTYYCRMWPNDTCNIVHWLDQNIPNVIKCNAYDNFVHNYMHDLRVATSDDSPYDAMYRDNLLHSYVHLEAYVRDEGTLRCVGVDMCAYTCPHASFGVYMGALDVLKQNSRNNTDVLYAMMSPELHKILHNYDGGADVHNLHMC